MSRAIISADVAGLLTDADVDRVAVSILASAGQQLLLMRVKGVTAVILHVDGVRTATHVPLRCRVVEFRRNRKGSSFLDMGW